MKAVNNLKEGDYIAFGFNYNGGTPTKIIVSNITSIHKDKVLVHFLYGHHSLAEYIPLNEIIAIGNPEGKSTLEGWRGKYDVLLLDHPLLKSARKKNKNR